MQADQARNASPAAIRVDNISKHYGPVIALDAVSLDIAPGEFVTLLGPSGSGKTSLLNIVAGFIPLDSGRLLFGDTDVSRLPPHKRGLGMVFQNYALFPHMTVARNVEFPLRARKYPRDERRQRVERALDLVRLGGLGERRIGELSGGQRQRVALARAVVFDPKIILMDEPLSALDKQLREDMQIELRQLHEKLGATTVYVTHDQREALTMSDRIAVMQDGRIVQVDTPSRLYDRPNSRFAAQFIGETYLIAVEPAGPQRVTLRGVALDTAEPLPQGRKLLLVLRAEKLVLADNAGGDNRLNATVTGIVYQGDSVLVLAELASGERIAMRRAARQGNAAAIPTVGQTASFYLDPRDTVIVAADESGR